MRQYNEQNLKQFSQSAHRPNAATLAHFDRYLVYDAEAGEVRWADETPGPRAVPGKLCGTLRKDGYRILRAGGTQFIVSRVAWYLYKRRWPVRMMSFADGNRENLRPDNMWEMGTEPPEAFTLRQQERLRNRVGGFEGQTEETPRLSREHLLARDAAREAQYVIEDIRPSWASIEGTTEYDGYEHATHHTRAFLEHIGVQHADLDNVAAAELALALQ